MKNKLKLKQLVLSALFVALISVFTAFFFHIPVPVGSNTAYIHFGDAFVFIAASLLPTPFGVIASALGGFLADIFCGAAVWAPFSFVIKGLIAFCFTVKGQKILNKRNFIALILALVITVLGYYLAEALIYGNWVAPMLSVMGNIVQIAGSSVLYVVLALALDKSGIKKHF